MNMEFKRKLPIPMEIKEQYPFTPDLEAIKSKRDEEIKNVFEGKDDRFVLVIGPCSADKDDSVIDYISRLRIKTLIEPSVISPVSCSSVSTFVQTFSVFRVASV